MDEQHRSPARGPATRWSVRFAFDRDAPEVVRLAGSMYQEMGLDPSGGHWRRQAREAVEQRLGHDVAVFVVDDRSRPGRLAACGAASIVTRLPGPSNPEARFGYIQWVSTTCSGGVGAWPER